MTFRETYEGDIKTIFDKYELDEKAKAIINAIRRKWSKNNGRRQRAQRENRSKSISWKVNSFTKLKSFYVSIAVIQVIYFDIWTKGTAYTQTA